MLAKLMFLGEIGGNFIADGELHLLVKRVVGVGSYMYPHHFVSYIPLKGEASTGGEGESKCDENNHRYNLNQVLFHSPIIAKGARNNHLCIKSSRRCKIGGR